MRTPEENSTGPYADESINLIYELLFCDNIELYKNNNKSPGAYPWDVLFADTANAGDLQKIIADPNAESRAKILAYNKLLKSGQTTGKKELLAIIVEVGLDEGLDVLASFNDGSARYINYTGNIVVWETNTEKSDTLTKQLFTEGANVVQQIGAWDKPRRSHPATGNVRLTFLVSDGIYFGEGPIDVLFDDELAAGTLNAATDLMQFLTEN